MDLNIHIIHLSISRLNTLDLSSSDYISPSSRFTIAICNLASLSYPTNWNDRDIKIFDNGDAEDAGGEDEDVDTGGGGFRVDSHSSPPSIAPLVPAVNSITHRRSPQCFFCRQQHYPSQRLGFRTRIEFALHVGAGDEGFRGKA
ncbi:hypothetical protein L2E82_24875 [Cichorium intybus]|uniref:Uncharacterized protein n=1 Tax=Cichorium intybus TaxID=13427 RepID=A0ACB9E1Z4_CICIN|nr:hypothetical protein L2E82_24875 [Cichorium intybus]